MRIIAGEFRSRRILSPKDGAEVRPMPDRVKESVFALLRGHLEGATVADFFAGSGSIGLEAISRGAARCVLVERDRYAVELIRENLKLLGVEDRCEVVGGDALGPGALARCPRPVRLVFMDPPYPLVRERAGWDRVRAQAARLVERLTEDGFLVLRTPSPHVHVEEIEGEDAPSRRGEGGKTREAGKKRERRRKERRGERREEIVFSIDEGDERADLDAAGGMADEPAVRRMDAELAIEGAVGPETHEYGTTAVHLYARRRT